MSCWLCSNMRQVFPHFPHRCSTDRHYKQVFHSVRSQGDDPKYLKIAEKSQFEWSGKVTQKYYIIMSKVWELSLYLENGKVKWVCPWGTPSGFPQNLGKFLEFSMTFWDQISDFPWPFPRQDSRNSHKKFTSEHLRKPTYPWPYFESKLV